MGDPLVTLPQLTSFQGGTNSAVDLGGGGLGEIYCWEKFIAKVNRGWGKSITSSEVNHVNCFQTLIKSGKVNSIIPHHHQPLKGFTYYFSIPLGGGDL